MKSYSKYDTIILKIKVVQVLIKEQNEDKGDINMKMKRMLSIILAAVTVLTNINIVKAEDEPEVLTDITGTYEYYLYDYNGKYILSKYLGEDMETIMVPSSVTSENGETIPIEIVGKGSYKDVQCDNVVIGEGIIGSASSAFLRCTAKRYYLPTTYDDGLYAGDFGESAEYIEVAEGNPYLFSEDGIVYQYNYKLSLTNENLGLTLAAIPSNYKEEIYVMPYGVKCAKLKSMRFVKNIKTFIFASTMTDMDWSAFEVKYPVNIYINSTEI